MSLVLLPTPSGLPLRQPAARPNRTLTPLELAQRNYYNACREAVKKYPATPQGPLELDDEYEYRIAERSRNIDQYVRPYREKLDAIEMGRAA